MKRKIILLCSIALTGSMLPISCSQDSSDLSSSLADIFIPNFSNEWKTVKGKVQPSEFFFEIINVDSTKGTGNFDSTFSNNQTSVGDHFHFGGGFQNTKVNLRFLTNAENGSDNGPQQGQTFKGKFDTLSHPFTIRLVNTNDATDSIVIEQHQ